MNWNFWLHTKISIAFPVVVVKEGGPTKLVIEDWMDHLTLQGLLTLLTSSGKEATIYVRKKGKCKNLICSAVSSRDGLNGKGGVGGGGPLEDGGQHTDCRKWWFQNAGIYYACVKGGESLL